jgi:hypothetical protein
MKIENLDVAVRYKERLDKLYAMKKLIESHPTTAIVQVYGGGQKDAPSEMLKEECLNGIIAKYCDDTIHLLEEAIKSL